jgi:hypothetical protein
LRIYRCKSEKRLNVTYVRRNLYPESIR